MYSLKGRKLYRRPADAILFGVGSGLAEYLQVDVVFVRLAIVVIAILTHVWPVVIAYAAAVILMPIHPAQDTVATDQAPKDVTDEQESEKESKEESEAKEEKMDSDQNM